MLIIISRSGRHQRTVGPPFVVLVTASVPSAQLSKRPCCLTPATSCVHNADVSVPASSSMWAAQVLCTLHDSFQGHCSVT